MLEYPATPSAENARDLSRAEWQRGMGMVVLSHLCDRVIAEREVTPLTDILNTGHTMRPLDKVRAGDAYVWIRAFDLARAYFQVPQNLKELTFPASFEHDTGRHTFEKTLGRTFKEGLNAQRYFPLNLASAMEHEAAAQSVEGYTLDSLTSLTRLFRRTDFHNLLTTCAFTTNGIWKYMSTGPATADRRARYDVPGYYGNWWFSFADGNVTLDANLTRFLRKSVTSNNTDTPASINDGMQKTFDQRPSSGCPVNHRAPHSSVTKEHMAELEAISNALGVESATLLRRRETTPIIAMTLAFADFLERVDCEYEQPGMWPTATIG